MMKKTYKIKILIKLMINLIDISKNDLRKYGTGILKNKIKYILVQDKEIDNASVVVSVKTGTLNDPKKYQGLAHFLEHMLFLGSKKYPQEDYFDKTLKEHGGNSNAFTDDMETVYYFSVNNDKLAKMIDIFSRFFIDPLFNKDSVNREINAVDSEHKKNINDNYWNLFHFFGLISKKNSQINRFGTGNLDTLQKKGIRDEMIKFYNDYYVSENICIGIISPNSLEKNEKLLMKYFGKIKHKKGLDTKLEKPYYSLKNKAYHFISKNKSEELIYLWEIPSFIEDINYNSWEIIYELFYDCGFNSLEHLLKSKKLINNLTIHYNNLGVFIIFFDLIKNTKKIKNKINGYFKNFMKKLKNLDWESISKYVKSNRELIFNNSLREDRLYLLQKLTINLNYYKNEDINSSILIKNIDAKRIKKLIIKYLNFDNCIQIVSSNKKIRNKEYKKEKYYEFYYSEMKKIESKELDIDIKFDTSNDYEDMNPVVNKIKKDKKIPREIRKNLWIGSTSAFNESIIFLSMKFYSLNYINTPEKYLKNLIIIECINYYFNIYFNQEFKIEFSCSLNINLSHGILNLYITGLNDKFNIFATKVFDLIKTIKFDKFVIESVIDKIEENILNFNKKSPWNYIDEIINENYNPYNYTSKKLLNALKKIKLDDIKNYDIFDKSPLEIFIYGNYNKKNIPKFTMFKKNINKNIPKLFNYNKLKSKSVKHPNRKEKNKCIKIMYPLFKFSLTNCLIIRFIYEMTNQPFFNKLRTKDQLGYLVRFQYTKLRNEYFVVQKIQSDKKLDFVEERINLFNMEFYDYLLKITNNEWTNWKKTIIKDLKQNEESSYQLFSMYNNELLNQTKMFQKKELLIKEINKIKLKDIQKIYKNKILNSKDKLIFKIK